LNGSEDTENKGGLAPVGPAPITVSLGDLTANAEMEPVSACETYRAADRFLQDPISLPQANLDKLKKAISPARMNRYVSLANGDLRLAIRLHSWNAAVAGSLLPTLHITEVVIRNVAMRRLAAKYGKHWYNNNDFLVYRLGQSKLSEQLRDVYQDEIKKGHRGDLSDYITSELTFGFWVNVFTKKFHPHLWQAQIHTIIAGFPSKKNINDLHSGVEFVRSFRNNVAHHKDLTCKPTKQNYQKTLDVIEMICPKTRDVAEKISAFQAVWQCAPIPISQLISKI
jgi:Abi-like protein